MSTELERLSNGLYIVETNIGEGIEEVSRILQKDESCEILDNIINPTSILLIFLKTENTNSPSANIYSQIMRTVPPIRIPTLAYGDNLEGRLKLDERYSGLGGSLQWIKVRCPRPVVDRVKESIQGDIRIGRTYITDNGWLYSRVRIPEPLATHQLQAFYTELTSGNSFRYMPVIRELKSV